MTPPLPIHMAASGGEMLIWLIVGGIWLIFQGLANAAKKKAPPPARPAPPEGQTEPPLGNEWRDLIETLTGQKAELPEEAEAPALPRPAPAPTRATQFPRQPGPTRRTTPPPPPPAPPPPAPLPPEVEQPPVVAAQPHAPPIHWRVAPSMRMQWPRSALGNLSVTAATRAGQASPLHRRLTGTAALRAAMVSRIVLGRPRGD